MGNSTITESILLQGIRFKMGQTITVNLINYGRMMPECFNSLKDYHQAKVPLRRNMENPLECQKAYITKSIFTSWVHLWAGNHIRTRLDPFWKMIQHNSTFIFRNKISGILTIVKIIKPVGKMQKNGGCCTIENTEKSKQLKISKGRSNTVINMEIFPLKLFFIMN